ncbi:phosphatase and actin regulator 2 [Trichonephila clavipes]|nr:phosphatase and actin regulator 2 [Trichonephila clavipes]
MQPKAKHKSSRAGAAKTRTETCEIVEEKQKLLDIREKRRTRERLEPIDENSACVEVGTTHKYLRRGEISGIEIFSSLDTSYVRASKGAREKKKKANGAMKTSSVEFISQSPTPSPMKSKHHRFVLLRRIFEPWQWKRRKKRNRFEQTSESLQRKISMRSTKSDQLVKMTFLCL